MSSENDVSRGRVSWMTYVEGTSGGGVVVLIGRVPVARAVAAGVRIVTIVKVNGPWVPRGNRAMGRGRVGLNVRRTAATGGRTAATGGTS